MQTIIHDICSKDLEEMVIEATKYVWVKLKKLFEHVVQGDPTNLARQLHLEEIKKHWHTRPDVEVGAQNLKGPHRGPTVRVELRRGHVQVLKQSTLECGQGKNETQDLN